MTRRIMSRVDDAAFEVPKARPLMDLTGAGWQTDNVNPPRPPLPQQAPASDETTQPEGAPWEDDVTTTAILSAIP